MSHSTGNGTPTDGFGRFQDLARRLFQVKREKVVPPLATQAKASSRNKPDVAKRRPKTGIMEKELRCSFCGKDKDQVECLVAGPKVFICGECVDKCVEIIEREKASRATPA